MRQPTSLGFLLLAVLLLAGCGTPSSATRTPSPTAPIPSFSVYGASSADGSVTALNASTGMQRWKVHPAGQGEIRLVAVNNSVLYLTVHVFNTSPPSFSVAAVNTRDGSLRWSYQRRGADGDVLALANGILYGFVVPSPSDPTLSNEVFALNADTGKVLWDTPTQFSGSIESILANGILYVASIEGGRRSPPGPTYLYGLDAITGAVHWQQLRQQGTTGLEAVSGDALYVTESYPEGPVPPTLFALDARTGAERWHQTASFIGINNTSVVAEVDQGDFSTVSVFLTALRGSDGSAIWRVLVTPFSTPVLDSGVLYATSAANRVAAFSANDGSRLWQSSPVPGQATSSVLTVAHSTIYAAFQDVGLFAFHAPDGKLLWQYTPGANVIAVQNGVLYGRAPNALVALDANTGAVYWQDTGGVDSVVLG